MTYTGEKKREYQRNWIRLRRAAWIEENGPCIDCGFYDSLEVDHKDAKTKLMQPSSLWSMSPKNPTRIAELAKCVVRCSSCHQAKTVTNKEHARHEAHGHAKLTSAQAQEIRNKYTQPGATIRGLAREYGVDRNTLRSLLRNETWV